MPRDTNSPGPVNPSTSGPQGYNPGPEPTPQPSPTGGTVNTFKDQQFLITCYGMKPNTVHKFYYEGVERGQDCLPVLPKAGMGIGRTQLGSPLITDEEGKIVFRFYYTLNVERQVDATNKTRYEVAGDKKFELKAVDSSAAKIVPMTVHYVSNPPPNPPIAPISNGGGMWGSQPSHGGKG